MYRANTPKRSCADVFSEEWNSYEAASFDQVYKTLPSGHLLTFRMFTNQVLSARGDIPVVCVHGLLGTKHDFFRMLPRFANKGIPAISFDVGPIFQLSDFTHRLAALLNHLNLKRVHILAVDFGALLVQHAAHTLADRIGCLFVINPVTSIQALCPSKVAIDVARGLPVPEELILEDLQRHIPKHTNSLQEVVRTSLAFQLDNLIGTHPIIRQTRCGLAGLSVSLESVGIPLADTVVFRTRDWSTLTTEGELHMERAYGLGGRPGGGDLAVRPEDCHGAKSVILEEGGNVAHIAYVDGIIEYIHSLVRSRGMDVYYERKNRRGLPSYEEYNRDGVNNFENRRTPYRSSNNNYNF